MPLKGLWAIGVFVLCAQALAAETPEALQEVQRLSLHECISHALTNNALLDALQYEVERAQARKRAADATRLPKIQSTMLFGPIPEARGNAVATETPTNDFDLDSIGPFFRFEAQIIQPIWTFGKISNLRDGARALVKVKEAEEGALRRTITTQVKELYHGWLFLEDTEKLIEEVLERIQKARKDLDTRLSREDAGVSPIDRFKLRVFKSDIQSQGAEVLSKREILQDGLRRLVALKNPWRPAAKKLRATPVPAITREALLAEALAQDLQLEQIQHGIEALQAQQRFRMAQYYPDLFLAGQTRYAVAPNRDDQLSPFANDNFNFFDAGIALGLRFRWDVGVHAGRLDEAHAERLALESKRDALREHIAHGVHRAFAQWQAKQKQMAFKKKSFKAARAWSVSALNGLELGTGSVKDAIEALKAHLTVRFELLQTIYQHNKALAQLSSRVGRELDKESNHEAKP